MHALTGLAILFFALGTLAFGLAYRGQRQLNRGLWNIFRQQSADCVELAAGKEFWRTLYGQIIDQLCDRALERNAARRELAATKELLEGQIYINKTMKDELKEAWEHYAARGKRLGDALNDAIAAQGAPKKGNRKR